MPRCWASPEATSCNATQDPPPFQASGRWTSSAPGPDPGVIKYGVTQAGIPPLPPTRFGTDSVPKVLAAGAGCRLPRLDVMLSPGTCLPIPRSPCPPGQPRSIPGPSRRWVRPSLAENCSRQTGHPSAGLVSSTHPEKAPPEVAQGDRQEHPDGSSTGGVGCEQHPSNQAALGWGTPTRSTMPASPSQGEKTFPVGQLPTGERSV